MGELEARVMEMLWERGGWTTPGEVQEALTPERDLAYTTVMTVLVRLWQKGLLERHRDGRAYAYHPVESREEWAARRMGQLLAAAGNRSQALGHFLQALGAPERAQLRRLLKVDLDR
ncbi:MAG: BlaI/MecI/CopY family transcriptional regulator [Actinomycetota bacterium]|nr:BlaI/MecI/CopY family transcriptional regulator [Actinomycetota bacterium]